MYAVFSTSVSSVLLLTVLSKLTIKSGRSIVYIEMDFFSK